MSEPRDESAAADHLDDVDDGLGCAEVWEELSERREQEANGNGAGSDETRGDDAEGANGDLDETAGGIAGLADASGTTADGTEEPADDSGSMADGSESAVEEADSRAEESGT